MAFPDQTKFDIEPHMEEVMSGSITALGGMTSLNELIKSTYAQGSEIKVMFGAARIYRPEWAPDLALTLDLDDHNDEYGRPLIVPTCFFMEFDQVDVAAGVFKQLQVYRRRERNTNPVWEPVIGGLQIGHGRMGDHNKSVGIGIEDNLRVEDLRVHRAQVTRIASAFLNREPNQRGY